MNNIFLVTLLPVILAYDADITLPDSVRTCYANQDKSGQNCIQRYLENRIVRSPNKNLENTDPRALDWIDSLGRNLHERLSREAGEETSDDTIEESHTGSRQRRGTFWNRRRRTYASPAPRRTWYRYRQTYPPRPTKTTTTTTTTPEPCQPPVPKGKPNRRVRKEIRTLTDQERDDFIKAVNDLKNDRSIYPNRYDALAALHQDTALPAAHGGPNFPSWHRWYLIIFEEALRSKNPTVTLPYWDSRLDFRMDKPEESVLWSNIFMGNPKGVIITGPFAFWITPQNDTLLRRDIPGPRSSLINPDTIQNVLNKAYNAEILSPTAAQEDDNLERHHDAVHRWVGGRDGHMGGLETSPQDPIFWLHHCFIDYLWETFRQGQVGKGVNPESDYPTTNQKPHNPLRLMDNLCPPIRNIEGYSNRFTRDIYEFAPPPTCENSCGGASEAFLFCNQATNQCQSTSKSEFMNMNGFSYINFKPELTAPQNGPTVSRDQSFMETVDQEMTNRSPAPDMHHFKVTMVDKRTEPQPS